MGRPCHRSARGLATKPYFLATRRQVGTNPSDRPKASEAYKNRISIGDYSIILLVPSLTESQFSRPTRPLELHAMPQYRTMQSGSMHAA